MTRYVEGVVSVLQCEAEGHLTPHLIFSGDTDMATAGLGSLSSVAADEIVLAELDASELTDRPADTFERRINELLGRDDLRSVQLLRVERKDIPAGLSFQEFQGAYSPPRLIFACPRCNADSTAVRTESTQLYERAGGKIRLIGDLTLRD